MIRDFLERLRQRQRSDVVLILLPAVLLALGALWLAAQFVEPAPPRTVIMSTGSGKGAYHIYGQKYAEILARVDVRLELVTSNGSMENTARLKDHGSGVQVALIQGGLLSPNDSAGIVSLGRVYQEPLWIFYRGDSAKSRLSEFVGLRLSIGPEGSGTRPLSETLLEANKVSGENTQFFGYDSEVAADKLFKGEIDGMFLASGAHNAVVRKLMAAPGVRMLSLGQAEAYELLYPYLAKVVLPKGYASLSENIPDTDIVMLATQASLVARADLHPAIIGLLVDAAKEIHTQGGVFEKRGEFPKPQDLGIPMSEDAVRDHASGKNFLHRQLPFWVATFIERMMVMLLPIATILLPLIKIVPWLYQWRIRSRIYYWYGQLKRLERDLSHDQSVGAKMSYRDRLARIEEAVSVIPVPLRYTDQLYMLRAAILLVRRRIAA